MENLDFSLLLAAAVEQSAWYDDYSADYQDVSHRSDCNNRVENTLEVHKRLCV